jgi:Arc/MetJ-type ribon-helix-helix transcriptional regulator
MESSTAPRRRFGGRPPIPPEKKLAPVSFTLPQHQIAALRREAERRETSVSEVLREVLSQWRPREAEEGRAAR